MRYELFTALDLAGEPPRHPSEFDRLLKMALAERPPTFLVDEAQWLNGEAFEYFRDLWGEPQPSSRSSSSAARAATPCCADITFADSHAAPAAPTSNRNSCAGPSPASPDHHATMPLAAPSPIAVVIDPVYDVIHTHTALAAHHPPSGRITLRPARPPPTKPASPTTFSPP
ncbi:ATP-binding protein [Streptomyces sp. NPDC045431]|uniref:ATP-binding protein n=1 Tax=Streptomyces sp. NPDC045431 TaxID=3155613 RepID=UPI0033FA8BE0